MTQAPAPQGTQMSPLMTGALWMLGSLMSFIGMALASRELAGNIPIVEILFLRSAVGAVIVVLLLPRLWPELRLLRDLRLHGIRNAIHFSAQYCWTVAVVLLPLAQVFALEFTMPIWVALLGWAILGEKITRTRLLAIATGFIGVLVITRPGTQGFSPAALFALLAAAGYGTSAVLVKLLTRHNSPAIIVLWMVLMQLPMALVAMLLTSGWVTPGWGDLPWIGVIGLTALSAHYTMAQALRQIDASVAIPIDFMRVPLIAVIGWLLYDEPISLAVLIGALLIFGGNYAAMRSEMRAGR